eukprot:2847720-Amphidinium_carterae.1
MFRYLLFKEVVPQICGSVDLLCSDCLPTLAELRAKALARELGKLMRILRTPRMHFASWVARCARKSTIALDNTQDSTICNTIACKEHTWCAMEHTEMKTTTVTSQMHMEACLLEI